MITPVLYINHSDLKRQPKKSEYLPSRKVLTSFKSILDKEVKKLVSSKISNEKTPAG